jgi:hypothetical protein
MPDKIHETIGAGLNQMTHSRRRLFVWVVLVALAINLVMDTVSVFERRALRRNEKVLFERQCILFARQGVFYDDCKQSQASSDSR